MNDERPIEKLLRRYAKKRGDEAGPPPALHPATRRMLQGEVARQFPPPAPASQPSATGFFSMLTRRWIYAVGVLVVLGVSAAMLLPALSKSKQRAMLAQKSNSEELAVRESLAPVAAPALAPAPAAAPPVEAIPTLAANDRRDQLALAPSGGGNLYRPRDESAAASYSVTNAWAAGSISHLADAKSDADTLRKLDETKTVSLGMSLDSAAPKPGSVTLQPPARTAGEPIGTGSLALNRPGKAGAAATTVVADGLSESRQTLAAPTARAAAPSTGTQDKAYFARGGGVEKDAERLYSQTFANVSAEQLRTKAAKVKAETPIIPVLANFKVQQNGNELRVIDGDGSTYLGEISNTTALNFAGGTPAKEAAAVSFENAGQRRTQAPASGVTADQQATQNYLWRVEGTNRTLNQNVVFTWNFVDLTNTLAASQAKAIGGNLNQDLSKLPSQFPMMLQNSIINGRAQLGPAQQIEVNAVPVKP